eukprot:jgi/Chrzof1/9911/Cz04g20160.t1
MYTVLTMLLVIVWQASEDALDLLSKMVSLDPRKRPSAEEALNHPYFTNAPAPTPPSQLPKPPLREDNPLMPAAPKPAVNLARPAPSEASGAAVPPTKKARTAAAALTPPPPAAVVGSDAEVLGKFSPRMTTPVKS